jgi:hypothetical protein
VLALREQVAEAERHLADLGPRPRIPGVTRQEQPMRVRETFDGLPHNLARVAVSIPATPTVQRDPTVTTTRTVEHRPTEEGPWSTAGRQVAVRGPLTEVRLLSGDDRFDRLADALDALADTKEAG